MDDSPSLVVVVKNGRYAFENDGWNSRIHSRSLLKPSFPKSFQDLRIPTSEISIRGESARGATERYFIREQGGRGGRGGREGEGSSLQPATLFDRSYYSLRGVPSLLMFPRRGATFKPVLTASDASGEKLRSWKQAEKKRRANSYFPLVSFLFFAIAIFARFASCFGGGEEEQEGGTDSEARRGR